ncbi:MAG TPA: hypothetical protein O0X70_00790 [Methanocorpusculum sp.]|nr:hypothetical protein [Methanocorpusculum sp.]
MKKVVICLLAAVLTAVLVCAGCVSDSGSSSGGFSDPVLGTWKMDTESDFVRYYAYTFNNDLTGKEVIADCETDEVFSEDEFTWIIHNDTYKTEPASQTTNKGEQFTISADGKVLTDTHGYTYHKI